MIGPAGALLEKREAWGFLVEFSRQNNISRKKLNK
jgi:hypothetical protein